ncbi:MAG: PIN domain-containing protein [Ilumatobacteraceae bacterium]|nr:PIN domain-containing protein [Ilumatobacteraceae bacterium]
MSAVFVDTSAIFAALDASDPRHDDAAAAMRRLLDDLDAGATVAVTHSGVVTEVAALVQRRLGMEAARVALEQLIPLVEVVWVDARLHDRAVIAMLAADRRSVSLVDWTSFLVMRDRMIDVAFAYDDDFAEQGFELFAA